MALPAEVTAQELGRALARALQRGMYKQGGNGPAARSCCGRAGVDGAGGVASFTGFKLMQRSAEVKMRALSAAVGATAADTAFQMGKSVQKTLHPMTGLCGRFPAQTAVTPQCCRCIAQRQAEWHGH